MSISGSTSSVTAMATMASLKFSNRETVSDSGFHKSDDDTCTS